MKKWIKMIAYSTAGVVIFGILAYLVLAFLPNEGQTSATPISSMPTVGYGAPYRGTGMMGSVMGGTMMGSMMGNRYGRYGRAGYVSQSPTLYQRSIQSGGGREIALFFYYAFAVLVILSALVLLIGLIGLAVKYFEKHDKKNQIAHDPVDQFNNGLDNGQSSGTLHDL